MEKQEGTERSDAERDVAKERSKDTFTCNGDGCLVTERAAEMFNLSCDPLRTTMQELRQKVRCRRCAEDIARKRDKRLGEPGCGVYPLAQTAKTMERGAGAVATDVDAPTYACRHEDGCTGSGPAQEMYNLQASLTAVEIEALLPLVRCRRHGLEAAAARGKGLCEPGSGVYRLSHTLKRIGGGPARSLQEQRDNEYCRWVLETKAKRERQEREVRIRQYALAYAETPLVDELDGTISLPRRRGAQGDLVCGIPVECCRHDEPARRFITVLGEVVGICDMSARVFAEVHEELETKHGEDQRHGRLLSTADIDQAQRIAAAWSDRGQGSRSNARHVRRGRG